MTVEEFLDAIKVLSQQQRTPGVVDAYLTGSMTGMLTYDQRAQVFAAAERKYGR